MKPMLETVPVPQGRSLWEHYCGFLNKSLEHFMELQDTLLMKQIEYLHGSGLWREIAGDACPNSSQEFRRMVPLTTYEDYREIFMNKREEALPGKVKVWARTTGSSGEVKWVPWSEEVYNMRGEFYITGGVLSSPVRGEIPIQPGAVFFYTTAPPPYSSGLTVKSALDKFHLTVLPPLEDSETMTFNERILMGFKMAMEHGRIDIIAGIASVLVSIGHMFESNLGDFLASIDSAPGAKRRLLQKYLDARRNDKVLLPKDFFTPTVILSGGADVSLFADAVERYWGRRPSECYGLTESGMIAIQPFGCRDMVFVPNVAYFEFVPEERYNEAQPATCLIDELEVGSRYEPVLTAFHGGCVFRYRTGDLVEVTALNDSANDVSIPTIRFYARADNVINFSGMVRLNERVCWQVVEESGIKYREWTVVKEFQEEKTTIRFYIESFESRRRMLNRLRKAALRVIPGFGEIPEILGYNPLELTVLTEGTFAQYRCERESAGADLGQLKPTHVNPKPSQLAKLKEISSALKER